MNLKKRIEKLEKRLNDMIIVVDNETIPSDFYDSEYEYRSNQIKKIPNQKIEILRLGDML